MVPEPRVGIPSAAAAGYDHARGDVIARLDADSRPDPRWVERIAARMADDPGLDAVTGSGRFFDLPPAVRDVASGAYLGTYYVLAHLALGHTSVVGVLHGGASRGVARGPRRGSGATTPRCTTTSTSRSRSVPAVGSGSTRSCASACPPGPCAGTRSACTGSTGRWRTLRLNWEGAPPWQRWWARLAR